MHCKSYSHFFSKKFRRICVSPNVNFNESLTNDVVSFEQLGPDYYFSYFFMKIYNVGTSENAMALAMRNIFHFFKKIYAVGTQQNHLAKAIQMSSHKTFLWRNESEMQINRAKAIQMSSHKTFLMEK